jgi:hypothetical protein
LHPTYSDIPAHVLSRQAESLARRRRNLIAYLPSLGCWRLAASRWCIAKLYQHQTATGTSYISDSTFTTVRLDRQRHHPMQLLGPLESLGVVAVRQVACQACPQNSQSPNLCATNGLIRCNGAQQMGYSPQLHSRSRTTL